MRIRGIVLEEDSGKTLGALPIEGLTPGLYTKLQKNRLTVAAFSTLLTFGLLLLAFKLPVEFSYRRYELASQSFFDVPSADAQVYQDAIYLRDHVPQKRIPLMAFPGDTKLLFYSGKVNYFDFYYVFTVYFQSEMQKYINQVRREQPKVLVIGKGKYQNDQVAYFLDGIKNLYTLDQPLETIDLYRLK